MFELCVSIFEFAMNILLFFVLFFSLTLEFDGDFYHRINSSGFSVKRVNVSKTPFTD